MTPLTLDDDDTLGYNHDVTDSLATVEIPSSVYTPDTLPEVIVLVISRGDLVG